MSQAPANEVETSEDDRTGFRRTITGPQLFFYTLGDVLGSGIYVLIGLVAAAVGGAFWIAFAVGISVAAITGSAYAELATKYPQAAGAALYVNKAFGNKVLTFLVTISFLSASFAAAGSLASGFATYFAELFPAPPTLVVVLAFLAVLTVVNFIGITESVVVNMLMTFVEIAGLAIIVLCAILYIGEGSARFGTLVEFEATDHPVLAVLAGVSLSFFAMTGFENTANVAEETVDPHRAFPRSLIGGMLVAGVVYVLVSVSAAITVDPARLAESPAPLLEVIEKGILPVSTGFMGSVFAVIAMIAITNTTLVVVTTQPRILYGMAKEDVVPGVFTRLHRRRRSPWVGLVFSAVVVASLLVIGTLITEAGSGLDLVGRLATVTVVFLLAIYALVIVATFKLRGQDEHERTYRANTPLLCLGLVGNLAILYWTVTDDPTSLLWCAGLIGVGVVLFVIEYFFGNQDRPEGAERGDPAYRV